MLDSALFSLRQKTFDLDQDVTYEPEDFMTSAANEPIYRWVTQWPEWSRNICTILHGPSGCGKTHYCHLWKEISKAQFSSLKNLCDLDPGQCWIFENVTSVPDEDEFFHFFNNIKSRGGHFLMTSLQPSSQWNIALPDLRSRLLASACFSIGLPDDKLLHLVLMKKFSDYQVVVETEIIDYIVQRIDRSFTAALDLAQKINSYALATHRKVTKPFVREVMTEAATNHG